MYKLKGKERDNMIRCCNCNRFFHLVCVGEDSESTSVWNCDLCCNVSSTIISMAQDILALKIEIGSLIRSVCIIPEIRSLDSKINPLI